MPPLSTEEQIKEALETARMVWEGTEEECREYFKKLRESKKK